MSESFNLQPSSGILENIFLSRQFPWREMSTSVLKFASFTPVEVEA